MNRLWVRLSLYFGVSVILGVAALILISFILNNPLVRNTFLSEQLAHQNGLIAHLADFYRVNQGWDGVEPILVGAQTMMPQARQEGLALYLSDQSGRIVSKVIPRLAERPPDPSEAQFTFPIEVNGQQVGHLAIVPVRLSQNSAGLGLLTTVGRILVILAISIGLLGLVFGVVVSRSMTAPLSRLADAARAIGARNFSQRIEPAGSEEMAEVALAFNQMVDALAKAEQQRRNLVADVAHELRTPLSVLQGNLRAILDDIYPLEKGEIARLYDQTRLLNRLVEELRELSRAEAGQLPLNLTLVDLAALVEETVTAFEPAAEAEAVSLTTDVPPNLPPLRADQARLTQILNNLLGNALRHTPAGGTVTVSAGVDGHFLWLSVRDTGEGIAPEHLPYVFDRFYRVDRARARADGGSGLGLAIVRAIVEAHAGQVSATSSGLSGEGSCFLIRLPLSKLPPDVPTPPDKATDKP